MAAFVGCGEVLDLFVRVWADQKVLQSARRSGVRRPILFAAKAA
jgi:hypothetical protein